MFENRLIGQRYRIVEKLENSNNEYLIEDTHNDQKRLLMIFGYTIKTDFFIVKMTLPMNCHGLYKLNEILWK